MGKILQILIIENRDLAHAQTFCTRVHLQSPHNYSWLSNSKKEPDSREPVPQSCSVHIISRSSTCLIASPADIVRRASRVSSPRIREKERVDTEARKLFLTEIESVGNYFNNKSFPSNESENNAFIKCNDDASAKAYCPKRWAAMQTWINNVREASDK